ncbi:hypothetical protein GCM10027416_05140 [Okibacterium endophyticum]
MSTLTAPHATGTPMNERRTQNGRPMKRLVNVARLHVVNTWTIFWIPLMILAFIWLVNVAIWWIFSAATQGESLSTSAREGMQWSGSASFIFVYMTVIAAQAMSMTFPFALGLSITRREFYLGSMLAFAGLALVYGLLLTVLSLLEDATNGWGFGGTMFSAVYFGQGGFFERLFVFFVGLLFFVAAGTLGGTIYMRWRMNGMLVAGALFAILLLGLAALISFTQSWPLVGEWFVASGPTGVVAWMIVPILLCALAGYLALSRATPKS